MKDIVQEIVTHPKTSWLTVAMTSFSNWWVDWGSPLVDALASISGLILVLVLIRYHWQNTKKIMRDNDKE